MNVDAHIHFWRLARGDNLALSPAMTPIYRDLEPPDLKPHLEAAEIGRIIVVQGAETLAENLYTLGLAARFSWIAGVVGWIQPSSPSIAEEVAALSANPLFRGVRPVRDDNQSIAWMLDRRLEPGWRAVREAGLVLEFLVQNPDEFPLVTHFVRTHTEMSVVLDHCAKPDIAAGRYEPWASDISELARHLHCVDQGRPIDSHGRQTGSRTGPFVRAGRDLRLQPARNAGILRGKPRPLEPQARGRSFDPRH
jgi:L-fuconolactonase